MNRLSQYLFVLFPTFFVLVGCNGQQSETTQVKTVYELMPVTTSNHKINCEYSAQMRGCQDIRIVPKVEGYLKDIHIKEGDKVKKGQLLFVIDQTEFRGAVMQAKALVSQSESLLAKAKQDLEGKQMLRDRNVISEFELQQTKRDLEVAKANLEAAKAQLEIANNSLSFTELRSPSDGVVGKTPYRKGDLVGPTVQEALTVVSDNHMMDVYFSLSESAIMEYLAKYNSMQSAVKQMPALTLVLPGGKTYPFQGKVVSVSGIIDEQTGTVAVRASFPNNNGLLLSGGTARVVLPREYTGAIVVPQEATFEILEKTYVVKSVSGKACFTIVTVEKLNDGKSFVVTSGLQVGDTIVASGAGLLHDGDSLN